MKNEYGNVYLPYTIEKKYQNAKYEWALQYVFPATKISTDPRSGIQRRHHLYDTIFQKAVKQAIKIRELLNRQVVILTDILLRSICLNQDMTSEQYKNY